MRFRQNLPAYVVPPHFLLTPIVNIFFLLIAFSYIFTMTAANDAAIHLPKTITSDILKEEEFIISMTAEQVIYCNNRVVTMKDLRRILSQTAGRPKTILIKADRRSAVGRLVDIWNLCRELGIEKINLATSKEK